MKRKEEQTKWQALALAYYDERGAQGISEDVKAIREPRDISEYDAIKRLILAGNFAYTYYDMEQDLKEIYGAEYDASRYYTKGGELKYKGGTAWIASVYTAKMAQAIEQLIKEL